MRACACGDLGVHVRYLQQSHSMYFLRWGFSSTQLDCLARSSSDQSFSPQFWEFMCMVLLQTFHMGIKTQVLMVVTKLHVSNSSINYLTNWILMSLNLSHLFSLGIVWLAINWSQLHGTTNTTICFSNLVRSQSLLNPLCLGRAIWHIQCSSRNQKKAKVHQDSKSINAVSI